MYDVSKRKSLLECKAAFKNLLYNRRISKNAKGILVGNKTDLKREVSAEEGMEAAQKIGSYFECSVSENSGAIDQIYEVLVKRIKDKNKKNDHRIK